VIGAVLIKNYASLDKKEKKFPLFIHKITTYQSAPKNLYVLKGVKRNQRGTKEEPKKRNQRETEEEPKRNQRGTKEEPKRNQRGTKEEPKRNQRGTKEEPKRNGSGTKERTEPPLPCQFCLTAYPLILTAAG
jgi:hypothetical protein